MKRYSPSATETWCRCPLLRALKREGWTPRRIGKRDLAAFYGSAFAAGMQVINEARRDGADYAAFDVPVAVQAAVTHLHTRLKDARDAGLTVGEADQAWAAGMEGRLRKLIPAFVAADPLPPTWRVRDVELTLPEWGHCRPDLVMDTPAGLAVVDYKVKLRLDTTWVAKEIRKWARSEQRFQYTEAVSAWAQEPVRQFVIVCVVDQPFRVFHEAFVTDTELQQMWRTVRERGTWPRMEQDDGTIGIPAMASTHEDQYGPCEFADACFTHRLDPDLMVRDYVKVPRKEK